MLGPIQNAITLEQVAALRQAIADLYQIDDMTIGWPHPGYVRFRGRFLRDSASGFSEIRRRFEPHGFTPLLREEEGEPVLIAMSVVFNPPASNPWINLALLIVTMHPHYMWARPAIPHIQDRICGAKSGWGYRSA